MSKPFSDLLAAQPPLTPHQLREQRVALMKQIATKRGRPLLVYATNIMVQQPRVPANINPEDIVPLSEIIESVSGNAVDMLLETPGGLAEVAMQIVGLLRPKFDQVGFIVPHMAMSAGTILAMSGDEILMDHRSSLGPIDPQFPTGDGRLQPAQAMLAGIDEIKKEAASGALNPAYIPILRNVDPGKLQSARNATDLSIRLVKQWLANYKFRRWEIHSSSGQPVTPQDRESRAQEIAAVLCNHQKWLSHGHPIKIPDLEAMKLKVVDYGKDPVLQSLIWALWVNLHHTMSSTNIYKIYESETVDLIKLALPQPEMPAMPPPAGPGKAVVDVKCGKCGAAHRLQCNFGATQPLDAGVEPFPKNCQLTCRQCKNVMNLTGLKLQLEAQLRRPIVLD